MSYYNEVEGLPISLISERVQFKTPNGPVNTTAMAEEKKTGTTTVGIIGKDFIVLAADQQATMGHMAADDDAQKIYNITDKVSLTISGAVGDSLAIIRFLRAQANLYEIERETKITPKAVTTLLSNVLNGNRYYPFIFAPIIGGINSKPELYELTPYGCISPKTKYAVTGSGTTFAITTLDTEFKPNMKEEEATTLAIKAIIASKNRDIYSGGKSISMIIIDSKGTRIVPSTKIEEIMSKVKSNFVKK
ncbi:MAG: proteasome subunit beta [Candidatus Diapherotrites archaeon]|jgi:proteasome beta subunit|uniref:proteasome endopeptidase complex n=1 Tax=Candidatus Iainarchaeum sp. TaxID=3101447 RepID=A0A7K4BZH9_9ARCH|nr:proteasome subunit beta [Candidatus Diapherotrites archaeon]